MKPEIIEVKEGAIESTVLTEAGYVTANMVEVEYFGENNARSVLNIMPDMMKHYFLKGERLGGYLEMDEWELRIEAKPTPTVNRLRLSFWREYESAQANNKSMKLKNVYSGICPLETFRTLLKKELSVAWILKPPVDYVTAAEETLAYGMDRLREIMDIPLYQTESVRVGKDEFEDREVFNHKSADLILKTVAMLDMRVKGAVVQKVQKQIVSVNKNIDGGKVAAETTPQLEMSNLDDEIAKMKNEITKDLKKVTKPFTKPELRLMQENEIAIAELTQDSKEDLLDEL